MGVATAGKGADGARACIGVGLCFENSAAGQEFRHSVCASDGDRRRPQPSFLAALSFDGCASASLAFAAAALIALAAPNDMLCSITPDCSFAASQSFRRFSGAIC